MNNIAESNPEGELERLGGVKEMEITEVEERINGTGEAPKAPKAEPKAKIWPVIVGVLVVLAAVAGGVTWWLLSRDDKQGDSSQTETSDDEKDQAGSSETDKKLENLSLDSEIVQKLAKEVIFAGASPHAGLGNTGLWVDLANGGSDSTLLRIALLNVEGDTTACKGSGREYEDAGGNGCISGQTVRQKAKELFGREISIPDGNRIGYTRIYDAAKDEFYDVAAGGGGGPVMEISHEIYKAETDGEHLYIYEYAAIMCMVQPGVAGYGERCGVGIDPQDAEHEARWFRVNEKQKDMEYLDTSLPGELIPEMTTGQYVEIEYDENGEIVFRDWWKEVQEIKLSDFAEVVDHFKWTFVKDEAGNYVFESMERVK